MLPRLKSLPISAFEPAPNRQSGEAGWTAGEIVSHNSDRLLWALNEAKLTVGLDDNVWPRAPEVVVDSAARDPRLLDYILSLRVVEEAGEYEKTTFPPLLAANSDQTAGRTHHGAMSVRSWLLLICIHDSGHWEMLSARQG